MPIPSVVTDPASNIGVKTATLNGTLAEDGGAPCECGFEWGETIAYGNTTPTQGKTTGQTFAQAIGGLKPATTYHFRAFASTGAPTPPTPYTGTWYFHMLMSVHPSGLLLLGLGNGIAGPPDWNGNIYSSTDYGDNWSVFLTKAQLSGDVPYMASKTGAGYLVLAKRAGGDRAWRSPNGIDWVDCTPAGARLFYDIWCPGGTSFDIWVPASYRPGQYENARLGLSKDGGLTWGWCQSDPWGAGVAQGQVRVNPGYSKGLVSAVGLLASECMRYSDNPYSTPGTWAGIGPRSYRFGVCWPYAVSASGIGTGSFTALHYSDDNGHTWTSKLVPPEMQGQPDGYYVPTDMCPLDRNRILCACDAGVFLSVDYGDSWTKVHDSLGPTISPYLNGVRFDPYNLNLCYAWGKNGFFRSDDGGLTWQPRSKGLELQQS